MGILVVYTFNKTRMNLYIYIYIHIHMWTYTDAYIYMHKYISSSTFVFAYDMFGIICGICPNQPIIPRLYYSESCTCFEKCNSMVSFKVETRIRFGWPGWRMGGAGEIHTSRNKRMSMHIHVKPSYLIITRCGIFPGICRNRPMAPRFHYFESHTCFEMCFSLVFLKLSARIG